MIYGKIFPTTRHSIHVREPVRKATLNGPKRYGFELFLVSVSSFVDFGYFWASKVTKNLNFVFLHCTFLSSPSDKFYPNFSFQYDTKKSYFNIIPTETFKC